MHSKGGPRHTHFCSPHEGLSESYMVYGYWSWSSSCKLKFKSGPRRGPPAVLPRTAAVHFLTSTYNLNFNSNTHKTYMHLKALKELYKMLSGTLLWTPLPSGANKVFLFFSCSGNVNLNNTWTMIASKVRITTLESPQHGLQNHSLPYHYVELIFLVKLFFKILCLNSGRLRSHRSYY